MTPLHDLLPWYANRTLEPAEAAQFEAHLLECTACRDELPMVEKLRARLEQEGEALLADHPSPVELVAALAAEPEDAELAPDRVKLVRRHLALCVTCGEEARWVLKSSVGAAGASSHAAGSEAAPRGERGSRPPGAGPKRETGASAWRGIPAWAWPAAALMILAVGLPLATRFRMAPARTTLLRPTLVEPTQRAAAGPTVVAVPPQAATVDLRFPVDVDRGEFPLQLEILGQDGRVVHREDSVALDDLTDGLMLQLAIPRADCPDGAYVARVRPGRGSAIEYPFRVQGGARE